MEYFFSPSRTTELRDEIAHFTRAPSESLYQSWARYNTLLRKCPHHGYTKAWQVQYFYNSLSPELKRVMSTTPAGAFMNLGPNQAWDVIKSVAMESLSWDPPAERNRGGMYKIDDNTTLAAQVEALSKKFDTMDALSKKFDTVLNQVIAPHPINTHIPETVAYTNTAGEPMYNEPAFAEVDFVGRHQNAQNNPYANTYNPGWRNHPNFSYRNQQPIPAGQPPFAPQPAAPTKPTSDMGELKEMMKNFMQHTEQRWTSIEERQKATDATVQNQGAVLRNLEQQVGQLGKHCSNVHLERCQATPR